MTCGVCGGWRRLLPTPHVSSKEVPDPDNATPPTRETFYELHDASVPSNMASGRPTV